MTAAFLVEQILKCLSTKPKVISNNYIKSNIGRIVLTMTAAGDTTLLSGAGLE
jgi:hypothetical protein